MDTEGQKTPGTTDLDVFAAQIEQGYRQLPIALAVNLFNGLVLLIVLWGALDTSVLVGWSQFLLMVTAVRYMLLRAFRKATKGRHPDYDRWRRYFIASACAGGLVWAVSGVLLFHPESFPHQVFLAFVLGGMVAGAIPLMSSVKHAYPCFAIPVVLPVSVQMFLVGDRVHLIMGLMTLVFGIAMLFSAKQVQRLFHESESLRQRLFSSVKTGEALEQMMRQDALTGIANRRLFEEELEKEWRRAKRDNGLLSVISADIDHFKEFNDHYGHPAGDECLVKVARAMETALYRPGDVVARIGGEEFAFLLPQTTLSGAKSVAEMMRQRILESDLKHEGSPTAGQVTMSFGIASSDHDSVSTPSDLLRASDAALYDAKRQGRNRIALIAE